MKFEGKTLCDRCKGDLSNTNEIYKIKWTEKIEFLKGKEREMEADFCKYCLRDFKHWIGEK